MNLERFGKLYDMLMTLPEDAPFDMGTFGTPQCGTPAWAAGWYYH